MEIAITETSEQETEIENPKPGVSFAACVQKTLQDYFACLDGEDPANLYDLVLSEMEIPLLKVIMRYTGGNQSKAAKVLGLSRGTLRKKLSIYKIE